LQSLLICVPLLLFALGGYVIWPSRFNVSTHLQVGGCFVSIIVPALILHVQEEYSPSVVDLYVKILTVGVICFILALVFGFLLMKGKRIQLSFEIMDSALYEKRAINITKILLFTGITGLIISYAAMGFIPMFSADPIAAKLFRAQYQEPYLRVAVLFRSSFYILSTIIPISCVIWYKYRSPLFFFATITAIFLMVVSLARSGAFGGVVLAFAIIMSLKSRGHFFVLMTILVGVFTLSAFFYYLVGIKEYDDQVNVWEVITAGTPDIQDQLQFIERFNESPEWTYGKTIYGGLIPGHYQWNPSVYTLRVIAPGVDINDVGSGGLRLPLPLWGYVSFQWPGVALFSLITGFLAGIFIRLLKEWFKQFESIVIRTIAVIIYMSVFGILVNFSTLNMFTLPPALVMFFYMYRFRWK
jgi:hypothetical protein